MHDAWQPVRTQKEPRKKVKPGTWWVIIRISEIALKRGNRQAFLRTLRQNINQALTGLPVGKASVRPNRGFIALGGPEDWPAVNERLSTVFGIQNYSLALATEPDLDAFEKGFFKLSNEAPSSFAVRAVRSDKSFPINSNELERELGGRIAARTGSPVNLDNPGVVYRVEVQPEAGFVYLEREQAKGGLPVGTGGRVAVLLSGGIDSPVAAYRMQKRGCTAEFIHFSSFPFTDASSREKARELARYLARHQYHSRLHIVPFGEVQQRLVVTAPAPYRIILYRRMMLRIAERIAKKQRCHALVTGESLGQVGSQTLTNMASIGSAVDSAILRPLIGFDKREVVEDAKAIGTYETSVEPDMDCCQYLVPQRVKTKSTPGEVEQIEADIPVDELIELAMKGIETEEYTWPTP